MKHIFFLKSGIENSIVLYILLFLACLNFSGRGPVIFFFFCLWGYIKTYNIKMVWNTSAICYSFMAIVAVIVSCVYFDEKDILKAFVYYLAFAVGYKCYIASKDRQSYIQRIVFFLFAGYLMNLLLTYYFNFIILGHVEGKRELYSIWTGEAFSVTLAGLMSCVPIAYSFYCFFCKHKWQYILLGALSVFVVVVVNMGTATRTPFVLMAVIYIAMLYELLRNKDGQNKKKIIIVCTLASFIIIYKVLPSMVNSAIAERFAEEGVTTSRNDITLMYIHNMLEYPYGGSQILAKTKKLAHNFILESYDMYSIFFFMFMIVLLLQICYRIYSLHRLSCKDESIYLLLAMYLSIGIQIMLEPVIGGYPQLLWTLFLIDGITMPYLRDYRRNKLILTSH